MSHLPVTRLCSGCEKELQLPPQPVGTVTHGLCFRHALEMMETVPGGSARVHQRLEEAPESFCVDLSEVKP